jgi:hypothetical protein
MDASNLVDHVPKQITALHAIIDATKHRGDDIASIITIGACQTSKIREQAGATLAVRPP